MSNLLLNISDSPHYDPNPQFVFMRSLMTMQQYQFAAEELKKEGEEELAKYWEYVASEQAKIAGKFQTIKNKDGPKGIS